MPIPTSAPFGGVGTGSRVLEERGNFWVVLRHPAAHTSTSMEAFLSTKDSFHLATVCLKMYSTPDGPVQSHVVILGTTTCQVC
ncbi:hypothetical protein M427DRAFT_131193 [Gonapodya prolifera JEL478]|uniref:Uncharacterized protein n=1 Tax=Gonapodya prolifera (strain JEL478) TaxID=1344416 RepID=A0A139AWG5_GONPJ|nr:hypothetical protein M427DRAFT_131193 [Gonapodya prolifera JEL478]|eukprot:KXS21049.1 hypothetical protein M427DRAFT_131193 [Gonapodya prolifera JEL478]